MALGINAPATPVASSGLALEPEQEAAASWSLSSGSGGERHDRHRSISRTRGGGDDYAGASPHTLSLMDRAIAAADAIISAGTPLLRTAVAPVPPTGADATATLGGGRFTIYHDHEFGRFSAPAPWSPRVEAPAWSPAALPPSLASVRGGYPLARQSELPHTSPPDRAHSPPPTP